MSYNQYSGYGGNPYGGEQQSYGASNPYSSEAGNPYGGGYEGQAVVSRHAPSSFIAHMLRRTWLTTDNCAGR